MKTLIFSLLLLVFPMASFALPCTDVANQAYSDINNKHSHSKSFRWANLNWLKQRLGKPEEELLANSQTRYSWRCGTAQATPIFAVTADANGKMITVSGIYGSEKGSAIFSADIPQSAVVVTSTTTVFHKSRSSRVSAMTTTTSMTRIPAKANVSNDFIKTYNQNFNTNFTNSEQVLEDNVMRYKTYYSKLKECIPGKYNYAALEGGLTPILQTTTILAKRANACMVSTTFTLADGEQDEYKCTFKHSSLNVFSEKEAVFAGSLSDYADDAHFTPRQKLERNQCDLFINGKLTSH